MSSPTRLRPWRPRSLNLASNYSPPSKPLPPTAMASSPLRAGGLRGRRHRMLEPPPIIMGAAPYRPRHLQATQRIWTCSCGGPRAATNYMHRVTCCDCNGPAPAWVVKRHHNQAAGFQPPGGGKINPFSPAPGAPPMRPLSLHQLGASPFAASPQTAPPLPTRAAGKGPERRQIVRGRSAGEAKASTAKTRRQIQPGKPLFRSLPRQRKISMRARSWALSRTSSMPCASRRTASKRKWKLRGNQLRSCVRLLSL